MIFFPMNLNILFYKYQNNFNDNKTIIIKLYEKINIIKNNNNNI